MSCMAVILAISKIIELFLGLKLNKYKLLLTVLFLLLLLFETAVYEHGLNKKTWMFTRYPVRALINALILEPKNVHITMY